MSPSTENFVKKYGTRKEVWSGEAKMTKGKLLKSDLMKRPRDGKLVSKKRSAMGKIQYKKNNLRPRTKQELAMIRPKKKAT